MLNNFLLFYFVDMLFVCFELNVFILIKLFI